MSLIDLSKMAKAAPLVVALAVLPMSYARAELSKAQCEENKVLAEAMAHKENIDAINREKFARGTVIIVSCYAVSALWSWLDFGATAAISCPFISSGMTILIPPSSDAETMARKKYNEVRNPECLRM